MAVMLVTTSVAALFVCAARLAAQSAPSLPAFPPECGRVIPASAEHGGAIPVSRVQPRYTPAALRAMYEGTVMLQAAVMADGTVCGASVVRSLDQPSGLDQAAIDALKQWRFQPRTEADAPAIGSTFVFAFAIGDWRGGPYSLWFPNTKAGETMPAVVTQAAPDIDAAVKASGLKIGLEVRGTVQLDGHFKASGVDVVSRAGGTPADGAVVMREILRAVEKWTFRPATNATGTPIPHDMTVVVHFPF